MTVDPHTLAQWDEMVPRLEGFMKTLAPVTEDEDRFYHIVSAISRSAIPNYWALRDAYSNDQQHLVAWACRNLLELAIFAQFVVASQSNMKSFAEDRLIDGHQIASLLFKMEEWVGGTAHAQKSVGPLIDEHVKMMNAEDVTRARFISVADVATGTLKKEFSSVNQLCSKFVHPTAWSLLTADRGPARFPEASELMLTFGVQYFMTVCEAFMPHIRKHGLKPNP